MDYYEELGIDRSATPGEIHRAHRRLTKLLHPDQQTDKAMKRLAETQMRRLNAIVETLSDPAHRRQYDRSLSGHWTPPGLAAPMARPTQAPLRQRFTAPLLWWIGSTIAAVVLTVGVVWFWANNLGSSFGDRSGAYVPSQIGETGTNSTQATPSPNSHVSSNRTSALSRLRDALLPSRSTPGTNRPAGPERTREPKLKYQSASTSQAGVAAQANQVESVVVVVPNSPVPNGSAGDNSAERALPEETNRRVTPTLSNANRALPNKIEIPPPPSLPANALAQNESESIPLPALPVAVAPKLSGPVATPKATASDAIAKLAEATPPAKISAAPISSKPLHQNPLEGEWVYAPKQPEKRRPGFYPPEFIDLKLFWNEGALHGQYRARYQVADGRPISPDVSFMLWPTDKDARNFVWRNDNGGRGTLKISSIDAGTIRVEWRTTASSHGPPALTAGMATLVRRSP